MQFGLWRAAAYRLRYTCFSRSGSKTLHLMINKTVDSRREPPEEGHVND